MLTTEDVRSSMCMVLDHSDTRAEGRNPSQEMDVKIVGFQKSSTRKQDGKKL
jgi:hypothetical protein